MPLVSIKLLEGAFTEKLSMAPRPAEKTWLPRRPSGIHGLPGARPEHQRSCRDAAVAVIDQAAGARQAGLTLRETTLVIFGSPEAGTPVMAASPLAALDLPQRPHRCASGFLAPDSGTVKARA